MALAAMSLSSSGFSSRSDTVGVCCGCRKSVQRLSKHERIEEDYNVYLCETCMTSSTMLTTVMDKRQSVIVDVAAWTSQNMKLHPNGLNVHAMIANSEVFVPVVKEPSSRMRILAFADLVGKRETAKSTTTIR